MKKLLSIITLVTALVLLALPLWAFADDDESLSTPNISVTTSTSSSTRSATFTLKSDSSDVKIYYTTDGSDPTTSSKRYTKSVKVTSSCEVRAVAYADGEYSDVGYYTVTVSKARVATPVLKSSNVEGGKKITITCSGASAIYYTTDGSTPTTSDTKYTSNGITVSESCTIKAIGVRSGYANSKVVTGIVTLTQVGKPTVKKSSTTSGTKITLSGPMSGCTYYYTTDGSTPTAKTSSSCKKYSSGITVTKACTIKFIACKTGYMPSDVYSVSIDGIQCGKPTYTATEVIGGYKITLKSATSGASIYYTTTGSTPSTDSEKYTSSGILVDEEGTTNIRAIAAKSGYSDSDVLSIKVSVSQLSKPSASYVTTSSSTSSRKIKLTGATGSTIYYTTDGSTPTTSSKHVSTGGTISVSSSCTLKAIAAKKGYANSEVFVGSISADKQAATPTVSNARSKTDSDGDNYVSLTVKSSTSGATIYYTTSGKDPFDYGDTCSNGATLKIYGSCVLKIGARKSGYEDSDICTYKVQVSGDDVIVLDADTSSEAEVEIDESTALSESDSDIIDEGTVSSSDGSAVVSGIEEDDGISVIDEIETVW